MPARIFIVVSVLMLGSSSQGTEAWADKKMPVSDGLEIWLDASKEMAARAYLGNDTDYPERVAGLSLDIWHDASGNKRDLHQPLAASRPLFSQTSAGAAVRFDGTNDFLFASNLKQKLDATTIFILAAPRSNQGGFGAFLAVNREGVNDYASGLNIDMASGAKENLDYINIEGPGFVGIKNLMTSMVAFGETRALTILAEPGTNVIDLRIDGVPQEQFFRPIYHDASGKKASKLANQFFGFDQITVGARFFSNTAEPPQAQGFLHGDISEVLIYNRILNERERSAVESYLKSKLVSRIPGRTLSLLAPLTNPPPVQMFLPGFTVRELPVTLNNINVVKYREDGKLVALGYDGNIWLLSDSDGDGLEDKVTGFWNTNTLRAPIGMALTPPNYSHGQGVFVSLSRKAGRKVPTAWMRSAQRWARTGRPISASAPSISRMRISSTRKPAYPLTT
jgi:hypothetical protein